jgi:hypothetical protein
MVEVNATLLLCQTMCIKSIFTAALLCFPKIIIPWRDSNPGLQLLYLVVRRLDVGNAVVPGRVDLPGEGAFVALLGQLALLRVGRHLLQDGRETGTDVLIFKIFSNQKRKNGNLTQNKAKLCKNLIITLVFDFKKPPFFRRKLAKIAENCNNYIHRPQDPGKYKTLIKV